MTTYVLLVKLTEKGKADFEAALKKREDVMSYIEKLGGKPRHVLMTFGRYDVVEIIDLPNDETAMKLAIKAAKTGDVKLETLRAFTDEEMKKIAASM